MAITVDSSQWTGERDDTPLAVPVVWGEFESETARDAARQRLIASGAHHGSHVPAGEAGGVAPPEPAANEAQVAPPDEHPKEADQRNQRQLGVGIATAATSMAAAGLVIATGGAALPAVAAAAIAGVATAATGETVANALQPDTGEDGPMPAPIADGPVLGLQAPDVATRQRAESLLRDVGARRVFVQETRSS